MEKNTAGDSYYRAKPCVKQKIIRDSRKPCDIYEELLESEGVDVPQSIEFEVLGTVINLVVTRINI